MTIYSTLNRERGKRRAQLTRTINWWLKQRDSWMSLARARKANAWGDQSRIAVNVTEARKCNARARENMARRAAHDAYSAQQKQLQK